MNCLHYISRFIKIKKKLKICVTSHIEEELKADRVSVIQALIISSSSKIEYKNKK